MNKDFLARFGVTEFHHEDPTGAYSYDPSKEYNTDGEIFVLGAKKDSMYLDNAKWLLIVDKKKNEKILYTLIKSESELEEILSKFSEDVKEESSKTSDTSKKEEVKNSIIRAKLKSLDRTRVLSARELATLITRFRSILEDNISYLSNDMDKANDFIEQGATIYLEEHDDEVDFCLSSKNGEKMLIMTCSYN